jgi:deazaflavin-dependent oxidoreductase (nitroreductase family)
MLWVYRRFFNPLLVWLLRSPFHWLASGRVMLITYTGRRTGRRITIPVSYRTSDSQLRVTVGQYRQKQWWRNLPTESPVELQLRGRRVPAMARAVEEGDALRVLLRLTPPSWSRQPRA